MKLNINVTDEDIKNGIKGDACQCPIALATKRAIKGSLDNYDIEVDIYITISDYFNGTFQQTTHKEFVSQWMDAFDGDIKVEPFNLDIEFEEREPTIYEE